MPRNPHTLASLKEELLGELGGFFTDVELDEKDYTQVITRTVSVLNLNRPGRMTKALSVTPAIRRYQITEPGLLGVASVDFVESTAPSGSSSIDVFEPDVVAASPGSSMAGMREREMGYVENARRVASADPEWHGAWEGDKYYLYVAVEQTNLLCSYTFTFQYLPTDDAVRGVGMIDPTDMAWLIEYATALLKKRLALIRGKFQGIVSPDGGTVPNNYAELAAEATTDLERLTLDIKNRRWPLLPLIG